MVETISSSGHLESLYEINTKVLEMTKNNNEGKNIVLSTLGIYLLMGMTADGLIGESRDEIVKAFGLDEEKILKDDFFQAIKGITQSKDVSVEIVNGIFTSTKIPIKDDFIDIIKSKYEADCKSLDFSSDEEIKAMNSWVEDKTHGLIKEILSVPDSYILMMLVNVLYFKAKWQTIFSKTCYEEFVTSDYEDILVHYLRDKRPVRAIVNDDIIGLELEYIGEEHSMVFIIDVSEYGVSHSMVFDLLNQDKELHEIKVPKFKFNFQLEFVPLLKELAIEKCFTSSDDYMKITKVNPCFISSVLQRSYIDVNEEGTEASSATGSTFTSKSIANDVIKIDKPFYFFIVDKKRGFILFSGFVSNPLK